MKTFPSTLAVCAVVLLPWLTAATTLQGADRSEAAPRVYRERIEPHWFADDDRFWYRNELRGGAREFVLVDAAAGTRQPAFDHVSVAAALANLTGEPVQAGHLPVERLEYAADGRSLLLQGPTGAWRLDLETGAVVEEPGKRREPESLPAERQPRPSGRTGPETAITFINRLTAEVALFWIDTEGDRRPYGTLKPGEEKRQHTFAGHVWLVTRNGTTVAVFEGTEQPARAEIDGRSADPIRRPRQRETRDDAQAAVVASPDERQEAFVRDHNLWLRQRSSRSEVALSYDGNPGHSFRRDVSRDRLMGMAYERQDPPATLPEVFWSPDSTRLVAFQTRSVPERRVHLIESSPRDQLQPNLQSYPYLKPGDAIPDKTPRLFDVVARKEILLSSSLFPNPWSIANLRWTADSARFTFVYNQRGHQVLRVVAVDAATGEARAVVEEQSPTFIDYSGKFLCEWVSDDELLWMSERDGWNHLYLYDVPGGRVKRQVTHGPWVVRRLVHLDRDQRQIWFEAAGILPGQDPYHVHLARADLDNGQVITLTEGDGTHTVQWSPDRRFFIATWSRVDLPPVHELRRSKDGRLLCHLESGDAEDVLAARGGFPQRFNAPGRDGKTAIYGILHRPRDFDPARQYPVVECIYAGPHGFHVPKAFRAVYRHQERIADRGFVVVQIDGMGTSGRSKAFHDVCWRNLKDAGFPDRIAWLRAAAQQHPELDLSRVGIYGGSAGGQNALAALLWHGDFYRVAVADCGCHDNRMDKIWWNEQWMGWPVGPHYAANSNVENAHRLQGNLLLIVGELDKNVDPASTLQVVGALQRANKQFEFQIIVGAGHGAAETTYGSQLRADFLVRHLQPGPAHTAAP
jgi:dipeptidyl-peptidase 4